VETLARSLKERGQEVRVITNKHPRTLAARELLDGVSVVRWHFLTPRVQQLFSLRPDLFLAGLLYLPLTLARLMILLRLERPDVINLHFVGAPALFVLLARWFVPFRLVVSVHGDDVEGLPQRERFDRWIFRGLLLRADAVTACSRHLLELALAIEPGVKEKARLIHNGIDKPSTQQAAINRGERRELHQGAPRRVSSLASAETSAPSAAHLPIHDAFEPPADLAAQPRATVVLAAGRMVPKKGFDVLLRARAASSQNWQLALIGDGPECGNLKLLVSALRLSGYVRFEGDQPRARVLEEIASADLLVIPSRQEPFGLVALEAMTLGKPVVATSVGGLPEVLHGADALLVDADDPGQLAKAIEDALQRAKCDPGFGGRNRECAGRFSTQRMVDKYLESYRK
jgi:glycosyltransferase involved in cell wall biosynthesis